MGFFNNCVNYKKEGKLLVVNQRLQCYQPKWWRHLLVSGSCRSFVCLYKTFHQYEAIQIHFQETSAWYALNIVYSWVKNLTISSSTLKYFNQAASITQAIIKHIK